MTTEELNMQKAILETQKLYVESMKLAAEEMKLRAEASKLEAEEAKLKKEIRWFEFGIGVGLVVAAVAAIVKIFG